MAVNEILSAAQKTIQEINEEEEKSRRFFMKRRHEIYNDGGQEYLVDQVRREFNEDALNEMRLAPINVLKKIVNKKASIYKRPPIRSTELDTDQALVDFYTEDMAFDRMMMKAHRYFHLFSNTALYIVPNPEGRLQFLVEPPYLYSVSPDPINRVEAEVWVFNSFDEEGQSIRDRNIGPGLGGVESWSRQFGFRKEGDFIDSEEKKSNASTRNYIFWSDQFHLTTNASGAPLLLNPELSLEEQIINPIGKAPVVNLAKDRDAQFWATQGEDAVSLALQVQMGWSDLLTIAKHQAFSLLTVVSEEEPKKLTIGVNRAIWLKQNPDGPTPSISYVQANSPIAEYKEMLLDLLALLLSTNDMPVNSVGGRMATKSFNSGFQALIEMSDTLEIIEQDKPVLRDSEKEVWEIVKCWHNYLLDIGQLQPEAAKLGRFSDDFSINISYQDIKPIESEQERIATVKELLGLGMITKLDAIRKLDPDISEEDAQEKLDQVTEEKEANAQRFLANMQAPSQNNNTGDSDDGGEDNDRQGSSE